MRNRMFMYCLTKRVSSYSGLEQAGFEPRKTRAARKFPGRNERKGGARLLTGRFNSLARRSEAKTAQLSTRFGTAQFAEVVAVAERVLLRDERMTGRQDFFNDTSVGIVAKLLVA